MANNDAALAAVRQLIEDAPSGPDVEPWRDRARATLETIGRQADAEAVDGVYMVATTGIYDPADMAGSERRAARANDAARHAGVAEVLSRLESVVHSLELEAQLSGTVQVGELHPWVANHAATATTNPKAAVLGACSDVEQELRAKLGAVGDTAVSLVSTAFSTKPPSAGSSRLRFAGYVEGTDPWTNAHDGAGNYGRGCFQRIRNLVNHSSKTVDPSIAIEMLAALSLLARWIDEATLVTAP
jgi:hypothetical protein